MNDRPISYFVDTPPSDDVATDYDRSHLKLYARLLDAEADGASVAEIVDVLFGIDAQNDPNRAKKVHDSHLSRARWMAENGYRDLLVQHAN